MTPNPIRKVLSTLRSSRVRFLLIGGQACVFYGAAEFSRDADIILLAERQNFQRLSEALKQLRAENIAVPPFSADYLGRGHAVHFRCGHPEVQGIRIDVMSVLRGVAPFVELWDRRTTLETESGKEYDIISLPDLVQTKKTQRDKDWPMIRRLIEANYSMHRENPTPEQISFWLRECRTPSLLIEIVNAYPDQVSAMIQKRPLLEFGTAGHEKELERALAEEESRERESDRVYWAPLKMELEELRHRKITE